MGFTAVSIVAPNVPDGVDPLTYYTAKPRDKAQELAQQQAQAAGLALFGGSVSLDAAPPHDDPEDSLNGSQVTVNQRNLSLTVEEKQAAQDAKTCVIPKAALTPPKGASGQNYDYAYLFPNTRLRAAPQLLGEADIVANDPKKRETSKIASTPAPVIYPTLEEMMGKSPFKFFQSVAKQYSHIEIVKIVPPKGFPRERLPFGQDFSGFKCEKQVFMSPTDAKAFNERAVQKGFFRAVLRFHATAPIDKGKRRLQKLPSFERKPVDLYRLFKSVRVRGGLDAVVKRKEWAQIGRELGYASQALPTLSSTLRQAYLRAIQPFEAFLEQNGVDLHPHVLPRLDVEDEGLPAKPRSGVRFLPNGIIVDSQDEKLVTRDREIIVLDEGRNQGPSYTLKSFRQKGNIQPFAAPDLSIDEKEALYWRLPSHFETEKLAHSPGAMLLPFPNVLASKQTHTSNMDSSYNPWSLSSLSFHDDSLARHVPENIDDFIIPHLQIGQQFATQDWHTASMGAYTLNTLVDGSSRTWYTTNNVFVDQHAGELVLIFPKVRVMNWCHGYSVAETVNLFPGFDWLEWALDTEIMNNPMEFCVQRLIYQASKSVLNVEVRKQLLNAIQTLREREQIIFTNLSHLKRVAPEPALGSRSITCAVTGAKRYWSWVLVDGETWSTEAVLQAKPVKKNLVFVTRYSDVTSFFDTMTASVETRGNELQDWREAVMQSISGGKSLPKASVLTELVQNVPGSIDNERIAAHLSSSVKSMQKWLELNDKEPKLLDDIRDAFNDQISCFDDADIVNSARQRAMEQDRSVEKFWNEVVTCLRQGIIPDVDLTNRLKSLIPQYPSLGAFIQTMDNLGVWARKAAKEVYQVPINFSALLSLKEQGLRLNIRVTTNAMVAIDQQLKWGLQNIAEIDRLMLDRRAFDGALIRHYHKLIDVNSLQPETRDKFLILVFNMGLIDRMAGPDLVKRPQRQEAEVLSMFPAFAYALSDLNGWLAKAQSLDWLFIIGQLQKLSALTPPTYMKERISTSQLMIVRRQMYELRIVPDDIALVQKTIEDAATALEAATPESRAAYGFDP